jgi:cell division protein FtsB
VRSLLLALALVAAAAAYAWLDPDDGVATWLELRADVARARARVAELEAGNAALAAETDALRSDPFAQERAVREVLRWTRPGEVLVRVPREVAPDLPPVASSPRLP